MIPLPTPSRIELNSSTDTLNEMASHHYRPASQSPLSVGVSPSAACLFGSL